MWQHDFKLKKNRLEFGGQAHIFYPKLRRLAFRVHFCHEEATNNVKKSHKIMLYSALNLYILGAYFRGDVQKGNTRLNLLAQAVKCVHFDFDTSQMV